MDQSSPSPTPSVSPGPNKVAGAFIRAKLNPMMKNYTCLEIWDRFLSGSPCLPTPTCGRNSSKRHWPPLWMRKLKSGSGQKQSGVKRTTLSWFEKGRPLNHPNHSLCKFLEKVEFIPLQMPTPPKDCWYDC